MIALFESIAKRSLSMWMVDGLSGSRVGRVGPSDRRPDRREFKTTLLLIIKVPRKSLGKLSSFLNIIIDLRGEIMPLYIHHSVRRNIDQKSSRLLCIQLPRSLSRTRNILYVCSEKTNLEKNPLPANTAPFKKTSRSGRRALPTCYSSLGLG